MFHRIRRRTNGETKMRPVVAAGEEGCVLVRPDMHVAWRANGMADDPAAELLSVLSRVLALPI